MHTLWPVYEDRGFLCEDGAQRGLQSKLHTFG